MGTRSTVKGYWRQAGNSISNKATPGPVPHYVPVIFDAAQAATVLTGVWLPKGAIVLGAQVVTGVTGGTTPLFDVGITGTADHFIAAQASDANDELAFADLNTGAGGDGVPLAADVELTAGDGGGTAGTGNVTVYLKVLMSDDGKQNN